MVLWINTFSNNYRGPLVAFIPHVKCRLLLQCIVSDIESKVAIFWIFLNLSNLPEIWYSGVFDHAESKMAFILFRICSLKSSRRRLLCLFLTNLAWHVTQDSSDIWHFFTIPFPSSAQGPKFFELFRGVSRGRPGSPKSSKFCLLFFELFTALCFFVRNTLFKNGWPGLSFEISD